MTNENVGSTPSAPSEEPAVPATQGAGWSGGEVVRDHAGQPPEDSGWDGEQVVRDQGSPEVHQHAGWSGAEMVKDHGDTSAAQSGGGWSGADVVRDHGDHVDPVSGT